jgi:hypothetical protein
LAESTSCDEFPQRGHCSGFDARRTGPPLASGEPEAINAKIRRGIERLDRGDIGARIQQVNP